MAGIRIHANSGQHINTYICPHKFLATISVTSLQHITFVADFNVLLFLVM